MKQRKNNKKGFTLVELLATITILAVVVIVAVPIVTSVVRKFNSNYYTILEGNLKIAGTDYFTDHKTEVPKYTYESSQVDVEKLVQDGYLEKSPTDEKGTVINNAYVITYKTEKGKYSYQACINTDNYSTEAEYCKAEYTIQDNIILVPPSNGVIAIPKKLEAYKTRRDSTSPGRKLVTVYGSTLQTKVSNSERKLQNTVIAPSKAVISCKKGVDCSNISRTLTGNKDVIENGIKKVITDNIGNPTDDKTYEEKLNAFLEKKVKVLYTYEYEYNGTKKTAEALYNIVKAAEADEPSRIQVVLSGVSENKGGVVYDDKGPNDNSAIDWEKNEVVASYSPMQQNEQKIIQYLCRYKEDDTPFDCNPEEVVKNEKLNVPYDTTNEVIIVYGVTKYGIATPNEVTYSVKTDTSVPKKEDIEVLYDGTKGNNGWYVSAVNVKAKYDRSGVNGIDKHISGYTIQKNTNGIWEKSNPNGSPYEVLNKQETSIEFKLRVCTIAGRCSGELSIDDLKIDLEKPDVPTSKVNDETVSKYDGPWTKNNIKWSDFSSDSPSGIDHYEYSEGCTEGCTKEKSGNLLEVYNYPLNNGKEMNKKFCIRAVSTSGNVSDWSSEYNFRIDNSTPKFDIVAKVKSSKDKLTYSSDISKLQNYTTNSWTKGYVFIKTANVKFGESGGSIKCSVKDVSTGKVYDFEGTGNKIYRNIDGEGKKEVTCMATSTTGNEYKRKIVIKVDNTAPEITSTSSYPAYGCRSFRNLDSNVVNHRYMIIIEDYGSGIGDVNYRYKYDDKNLVNWANDNMLTKARSNTIVWAVNDENNYIKIRQDYNLASESSANFDFNICDNVGNCRRVENYRANSGTSDTSNSGKYCRELFGITAKEGCGTGQTNCYLVLDKK